ncbi:unnamed protein product [Dracunculus medinensis]|uniref:NADH dehydrogenase [ubiquinone] iron-sulfur protein 3, mitochondrial n=1 Tax=Dracunculus medinensis TaxID=318479 RepID=A0A0N4U5W7_DRAME|nr:unnamed protein product [Dracunculus medinensis]
MASDHALKRLTLVAVGARLISNGESYHVWKINKEKRERLANFGRYTAECLPKFIQKVQFAAGDELELLIHPTGVIPVISFLKGNHSAQFTNLIFICGVDVPTRKNRFEVIYSLLSTRFNARVRVRTYTDEVAPIDSITSIFRGANWSVFNFKHNIKSNLEELFSHHPLAFQKLKLWCTPFYLGNYGKM